MKTKPIILVAGGTGYQGGSVARALLRTKKYTVRVLTRNVNSHLARVLEQAGAELIQGDLDHVESLKRAMKGCYGVFGVTSFWEHYAKEYQQGVNLIDAVNKSGVKYFVLSAQPDYYEMSKGRYSVPQTDIKAALEQYSRGLGLNATYIYLSFYYENFFEFFALQKTERGFSFGFPQGNTRLAAMSVEDTGDVVVGLFDNPEKYAGRSLHIVGDNSTCDQYAAIMSGILGKNVYYEYIPRNEYAAYNFAGAEELANMFEVQRLYIPQKLDAMKESYELNPSMQSFSKWVSKNKQRFLNHFNSHMEVIVI